jgi:hypothetical protein
MAIFAIDTPREVMIVFGLGAAIYAFFFLLGFGFSSAATFYDCEKVDPAANAVQGAIWAVYPTIAWFIIRTFEIVRQYFDRFYMMFDPTPSNAGWVSVGYVMMLACIVGIYGLSYNSHKAVCIASIDEVAQFKKNMLERQAEHDQKIKAAQESTPAVTVVSKSARSDTKQSRA